MTTYRADDADYLVLGQGSMITTAEVVADYLRETRGIRVGVVNLVMFRPFPADLLSRVLKGKKGVAVLESTRPTSRGGTCPSCRKFERR